jgi:hypothetical protein
MGGEWEKGKRNRSWGERMRRNGAYTEQMPHCGVGAFSAALTLPKGVSAFTTWIMGKQLFTIGSSVVGWARMGDGQRR